MKSLAELVTFLGQALSCSCWHEPVSYKFGRKGRAGGTRTYSHTLGNGVPSFLCLPCDDFSRGIHDIIQVHGCSLGRGDSWAWQPGAPERAKLERTVSLKFQKMCLS